MAHARNALGEDSAMDSSQGVGMASCWGDGEVLQFSADTFRSYAASGKRIDRPVLIKERFSDAHMHTLEGYATSLRDGFP